MLYTNADVSLIDAVESGRLDAVRKALNEGANPNTARKVVQLWAAYRLNVGGMKTGTDTTPAESALVLAVRDGKVDIVKELVRAGADPNAPVSWRLPHSPAEWTEDAWTADHWPSWRAFSFPSALAFALFCTGEVFFNKPGGHVTYNNPTHLSQVCDARTLAPRLDVVAALVEGGAKVDERMVERAKEMRNQAFGVYLEERLRGASSGAGAGTKPAAPASGIRPPTWYVPPPAVSGSSASSSSAPRPTLPLGADATPDSLASLAAALSTAEESRRATARLQLQLAEVQRLLADQNARIVALEEDNADLTRRLAAVESGGAGAGGRAGRDREGPTPVRKVYHVVGKYEARGQDEVGLEVGDEVFVSARYSDGWANGFNTRTSASGFFPLSCCSPDPPSSGRPNGVAKSAVPARTSSARSSIVLSPV